MFIINSIAPIFLLILFGKLLRKNDFLPESFFKGVNKLVFWFALPALLISRISMAELELAVILKILLLCTLGTVLSLGVAWGISRFLKLPSPSTGSFIQGSFRSNGAFVGLPVIIYTLGTIDPRAEILGTVLLAPLVIIYNILGVITLLHYGKQGHNTEHPIATILGKLLKNPLILSCAAGIGLNLLGIALPTFLFRPLDLLGQAALPMILMSIGASLIFEPLHRAASPCLIASLIKVAISPLLGFALAMLFDLSSTEKMIAILYLACPAAGMSYVMAEVMGCDGPLAGRIVALSTLLSALTLPILIAIGL